MTFEHGDIAQRPQSPTTPPVLQSRQKFNREASSTSVSPKTILMLCVPPNIAAKALGNLCRISL
jgi:hypothetical protein